MATRLSYKRLAKWGALQLTTGQVTGALTVQKSALQSPLTSALAGYKLYCVTFKTPPASGAAVANDSGAVSLSLAALGVPFGCFVLDTSGAGVATLIFTTTTGGQSSGQTASFSGNASLGDITVDSSTGFAQATIPSGGQLVTTTPSDVACPVGTWDVTADTYTCNSDGSCVSGCTPGDEVTSTATVWIVKDATTNSLKASFTHWSCQNESWSNVPATFSNNVLTIGPFVAGQTQTLQATVSMTVDATNCTSATGATITWEHCFSCTLMGGQSGCEECDPNPPNACGGGSTTCSSSLASVTKE